MFRKLLCGALRGRSAAASRAVGARAAQSARITRLAQTCCSCRVAVLGTHSRRATVTGRFRWRLRRLSRMCAVLEHGRCCAVAGVRHGALALQVGPAHVACSASCCTGDPSGVLLRFRERGIAHKRYGVAAHCHGWRVRFAAYQALSDVQLLCASPVCTLSSGS